MEQYTNLLLFVCVGLGLYAERVHILYKELLGKTNELSDRWCVCQHINGLLHQVEKCNEHETADEILQPIASRFEWQEILKKERNEWRFYVTMYTKITPERYYIFKEEDTKNDILEILKYAKNENDEVFYSRLNNL